MRARLAAIAALALALTLGITAPASAHAGVGGYCGHTHTANPFTGLYQGFMWETTPTALGYSRHLVYHGNVYTGGTGLTQIHVCNHKH